MLECTPVTSETLRQEALALFENDWRFVTATATLCPPRAEGEAPYIDLLYTFDKDMQLKHLRLSTPEKGVVPSLTPIYFAATLIENEMRDLFGLTFEGLVLDYNGTLYLDGDLNRAPFCTYTTVKKG